MTIDAQSIYRADHIETIEGKVLTVTATMQAGRALITGCIGINSVKRLNETVDSVEQFQSMSDETIRLLRQQVMCN